MKPNPEGLSEEDINRKIEHLEKGIFLCLLRSGPRYCVNRKARVKLLKSYLEESVDISTEKGQII